MTFLYPAPTVSFWLLLWLTFLPTSLISFSYLILSNLAICYQVFHQTNHSSLYLHNIRNFLFLNSSHYIPLLSFKVMSSFFINCCTYILCIYRLICKYVHVICLIRIMLLVCLLSCSLQCPISVLLTGDDYFSHPQTIVLCVRLRLSMLGWLLLSLFSSCMAGSYVGVMLWV